MARKTKETLEAATPLVVCVDSCHVHVYEFGHPIFFARGERVSADHPAVKQAPELFAPDGLPNRDYANLAGKLREAT